MVTSVTNFGRSGLHDYLLQRVSAVILAAYVVFIVAYLALHPDVSYEQWHSLFGHLWMRVFSLATLLSLISHAWIGLWIVLTDYLTVRLMGPKAAVMRIFAQVVLGAVSTTYLVWGIEILWGFK